MQRRGLVVALVIPVALGVAFVKWPRKAKPRVEAAPLPTARVEVESFDVILRVPGVLETAKSEPLLSSVQQSTISWIEKEGKAVKPGDVVVRLNAAEVTKQLTEQEKQDAEATQQERTAAEDAQRRVQTAKVGLEKAKSDLVLVQSQTKAAVEQAEAQLNFTEQERRVAQIQYDRNKRLADEHLMPLAQLEATQDQLRDQDFALETSRKALDKAKRDATINEEVKKLDLRKAEMEVQSARSAQAQSAAERQRTQEERKVRLTDVREQVASTELKAKSAGMLLLGQAYGPFDSHTARVGDQVWEGMKLASIIDPGNMRVLCDVGEGDIARVRIDQPGLVQVDAIGARVLHGKVVAIDNISRDREIWEGGTPKRIFNVKLQLTDRDTRLRPGMSATVEVVLERAKDELSVPADAVFRQGGKDVVYGKRGDRFEAVPVKVLRRSEMRASVKGEVHKGDEVARRQPPADLMVGAKERKR